MKLTKKNLIELLRILEEGGTAYQAKKETGVSISRVYQIWNEMTSWKNLNRAGEILRDGKNLDEQLQQTKRKTTVK